MSVMSVNGHEMCIRDLYLPLFIQQTCRKFSSRVEGIVWAASVSMRTLTLIATLMIPYSVRPSAQQQTQPSFGLQLGALLFHLEPLPLYRYDVTALVLNHAW
jgi:hypothetical protein